MWVLAKLLPVINLSSSLVDLLSLIFQVARKKVAGGAFSSATCDLTGLSRSFEMTWNNTPSKGQLVWHNLVKSSCRGIRSQAAPELSLECEFGPRERCVRKTINHVQLLFDVAGSLQKNFYRDESGIFFPQASGVGKSNWAADRGKCALKKIWIEN